jgi:hypothetical protein
MNTLQHNLDVIASAHAELQSYAKEVLPHVRGLLRSTGYCYVPRDGTMGRTKVSTECSEAIINYENSFAGCPDWYEIRFPVELWGGPPGAIAEHLRAVTQKANDEARAQRAREIAELNAANERRDREQYQKLKAKYEGSTQVP